MLVPFIDNLASKCHAFWMTFLQSCHTHPWTSAQFSGTELNSTLGQTTDSFILHQMWPSLTLVTAAVLYKLFQGYPFRIRAEAASEKRKRQWSKMTDKSTVNTEARNHSWCSPANCSRLVPPGSWKEWPGSLGNTRALSSSTCFPSTPATSHAAHLPALPTLPPVRQQYWTEACHLSCHPQRDLFQLPHSVQVHMDFYTFTSGRELFQ